MVGTFCLALTAQVAYGRPAKSPVEGSPAEEQVRKLLASSQLAEQARDFPAALRALSAAFRIQPGPELLCELGALAASQELLVEAQDLFRRCLGDVGADKLQNAARTKPAQEFLLRPRPAAGQVQVFGRRGSFVLVDDRLVGVLPLGMPLLLPIGRHLITVESDGARLRGPVTVRQARTAEMRFSQEGGAILTRLLPAVLLLCEFPQLPAQEAAALTSAAEQFVQRQQRAPFRAQDALALAPNLADCLKEKRCPAELLLPLGVDSGIVVRVKPQPGAARDTRTIQLTLLDSSVGDAALSLERSCTACSGERAAGLLFETLSQLLTQGSARPRGFLSISSTPSGAELLLDDHPVGQTPYEHPAWAGSHQVRLRLPGYESVGTTALVKEAEKASLSLTLPPEVPPPLARPLELPETIRSLRRLVRMPRPRWRLALGSLAMAAGSLSIGFGASALAVSGNCIVAADVGQCRNLYGTGPVGGSLLGVGILLTLGGTVLVAIPGKMRQLVGQLSQYKMASIPEFSTASSF
jgi:hypothetical protein